MFGAQQADFKIFMIHLKQIHSIGIKVSQVHLFCHQLYQCILQRIIIKALRNSLIIIFLYQRNHKQYNLHIFVVVAIFQLI